MDLTLVIMAAGLGSRFGGIKQVEPVGPNGELLIDYAVYDAKKAGFNKVVFIINNDIEKIFKERVFNRISKIIPCRMVFQHITDFLPKNFTAPEACVKTNGNIKILKGQKIAAALQRIKPWGTAHAVLCAKNAVRESFALINADDFYGRDAFLKLAKFLSESHTNKNAATYAMVAYELGNTLSENGKVSRGICKIKNNFLTKITEVHEIDNFGKAAAGILTSLPLNLPVSMNCWGFMPDLFDKLEEEFHLFLQENKDSLLTAEYGISTAIGNLIRNKIAAVKMFKSSDKPMGFTYRQDKQKIAEQIGNLIAAGVYPQNLWS